MSLDRYAVLASAIAVRRIAVSASDIPTSYTDGQTVYVDNGIHTSEIVDVIAVQAALIGCNSLQRDLMTVLARQLPSVAGRYLVLELGRLAHSPHYLLPGRTARRIKSLKLPPLSATSQESLARARGREPIPAAPYWAGSVRPAVARGVGSTEPHAAARDRERQYRFETPTRPTDRGDGDKSLAVDVFTGPRFPSRLGEAFQRLLGMSPGGFSNSSAIGELPVARHQFGPVDRHASRARLRQAASAARSATRPAVGIRYSEWDCHKGSYRPLWCTVTEYDPVPAELAATRGMRPESPPVRQLAGVERELEPHRQQPDGDNLDLSAFLDYQADAHRRSDDAPRIYVASRRTKQKLSALVLLDCSGSTDESAGFSTVFEEQRQLAAELTVAFERLGNRVATFGFYSRGKDAVRILRIKDFTGRFDGAARRRLNSIQARGFTRTGAAIRYSSDHLESQASAQNMVLIVIGDGLPYDHGYEHRYARADTRRSIQESMLRGVGVAGVAIRSSTDPAVLEDIWSDTSFRVVERSADIHLHLRALIGSALRVTRVDGRRRHLLPKDHDMHLRTLKTLRCGSANTYV